MPDQFKYLMTYPVVQFICGSISYESKMLGDFLLPSTTGVTTNFIVEYIKIHNKLFILK